MKPLNEFLNEAKLKDFEKVKSKRIIPLGIKGSDIGLTKPQEMPKLTVAVGFAIQEELPRFLHDYFYIDIIGGEITLVLSQKGQRAIRVRTESDPNYLDKTIEVFKKNLQPKKI
tara:strand:+ start:338 stop:679 length:342 start_codon:yes stop_codon:yes gene_type:complete